MKNEHYINCGKKYFDKFNIDINKLNNNYDFIEFPESNDFQYYVAMMRYLNLEVEKNTKFFLYKKNELVKNVEPIDVITCQCIFINKGSRCETRTKYAPLCETHAEEVYGVQVRKTEDRGNGIFACRNLRARILLPYIGIINDD